MAGRWLSGASRIAMELAAANATRRRHSPRGASGAVIEPVAGAVRVPPTKSERPRRRSRSWRTTWARRWDCSRQRRAGFDEIGVAGEPSRHGGWSSRSLDDDRPRRAVHCPHSGARRRRDARARRRGWAGAVPTPAPRFAAAGIRSSSLPASVPATAAACSARRRRARGIAPPARSRRSGSRRRCRADRS